MFLLLLAAVSAPALADPADDLQACIDAGHTGDGRATVASCSKTLGSPALADEDRVTALSNRSLGYRNTGDFDAAIGDCNAALKLDADSVAAHYACGQAYGSKGDYRQAEASFSRVIDLKPDFVYAAAAHNARGNIYDQIGAYDKALADFDAALKLNPYLGWAALNRGVVLYNQGRWKEAADALQQIVEDDRGNAYAVLWHVLAQRRLGQGVAMDLFTETMTVDTDQWPGPILRRFRNAQPMFGQKEPETGANLDPELTPQQDCETAFYEGEWSLLDGDKDAARRQLRHAADTCPKTFIEHAGAIAELERM
ncbi:MAG TPA: tetratricopeptide repeat protein [Candidatus Cybelea sp.]|nr:tetratricopeptide repeat protein [Candidatus Cybelea sp.]